jgi:glutathione S-transferase
MATAMIFGPAYSTYTRTARLAMEEKGAEYRLEEVDLLGGATGQPTHLARQPFGKVPAFEQRRKAIYEDSRDHPLTSTIFPGPPLQPPIPCGPRLGPGYEHRRFLRLRQFIGKVFWQRAVVPMQGGQRTLGVIEQATPLVEQCLA